MPSDAQRDIDILERSPHGGLVLGVNIEAINLNALFGQSLGIGLRRVAREAPDAVSTG